MSLSGKASMALEQQASARKIAAQRLERIASGGAYMGQAGGAARLERKATDLVAGVMRWRRYLDFLIGRIYKGSFPKMEPLIKQILRICVYELVLLQKAPHGPVHEAVDLAKTMMRPGAGRLVNAILRSLQRQELPVPRTDDVAEHMGITLSHPTWIVRRWLRRFGREDCAALLTYNNARPIYGLRGNPLLATAEEFRRKLDEAEVAWAPSPYLDDFVRAPQLQRVLRAGWLQDGVCAVQDESAGLAVRLLDPQPGETLVDTCAAPGGKAIYAALQMRNQGRVLAMDINRGRLALAQKAAAAHGVAIVETETHDLCDYAHSPGRVLADRVLLDAPCTGLGVLARRADLRWRRSPGDLRDLVTLQDQLLDAAARLVRPGGVLLYSTCSIEKEENEDRIAAFLSRQEGFHVEMAMPWLPEALVTPEGYLATLPHRHGVDGAFAARLRRTSA